MIVCSRTTFIIAGSVLLVAGGLHAAAQNPQQSPPPAPTTVEGHIVEIEGQTLTVAVPKKIKVIGSDAQQKVDALSLGDRILFPADPDEIQAASVTKDKPAAGINKANMTLPVSVERRLTAGFIALVFVFLIAGLATGGSNNGFGNPLSFCVGIDNRTSNSQTQMVFWSATVLVAYLTTVFLRGWMTDWNLLGGVGIPPNLLAFSGLSALSFGGARTITVSKVNAAKAAGAAAATAASATAEATAKDAQAKGSAAASAVEAAQVAASDAGAAAARTAIDAAQEAVRIANSAQAASEQASKLYATSVANIKQAPAGTARITQLFQDDSGRADLGDTQMILITLIAIGTYVVTSFHQLGNLEIAQQVSLPDIDSYLLASFGIGQSAYLAKKAASNIDQ